MSDKEFQSIPLAEFEEGFKHIDISPRVYKSKPKPFSTEEKNIMAHNVGLIIGGDGTYIGNGEDWDKYDYILSSAK